MFDNWYYDEEEGISRQAFLERQRKNAENSYKKYPECERRYCSRCGELLVATSASYYEGFHIDSCD